MDYTYELKEVTIDVPENALDLDSEAVILALSEKWDLADAYDSHRIRDLTTGEGKLEYKKKVPFLGHTMFLHKTTNKFWIWYSDIFGIAMLVIAITGMLITKGKNSFKKRGWKLTVLGLIFPVLILILFA